MMNPAGRRLVLMTWSARNSSGGPGLQCEDRFAMRHSIGQAVGMSPPTGVAGHPDPPPMMHRGVLRGADCP
jgi:hypothetical protein